MAKTSWMVPLALSVLLIPCTSAQAATPRTLLAKVERVSTGNTFLAIAENGTKLRIRLLGIDAPEIPHGKKPGQPFREEARKYLARLIGGRTIRVETYGPDGFNHTLAMVFLGPVNVNVEMVEQGLAEGYRGAPCKAYCRDLRVAELRAKRNRVGMWAQREKSESPAPFRKRTKIQGTEHGEGEEQAFKEAPALRILLRLPPPIPPGRRHGSIVDLWHKPDLRSQSQSWLNMRSGLRDELMELDVRFHPPAAAFLPGAPHGGPAASGSP